MKKIILLAIIAISVNTFAQKSCKYDLNKKDEFTKKYQVRTKNEILFDNTGGAVAKSMILDVSTSISKLLVLAAYDGGNIYLGFSSSDNNYTKLEFLLSDESVVELEKDIQKFETGQRELWYLFTVSEVNWNKLKQTPVEKVRFVHGSIAIRTVDIKEKLKNSISNVINCLDNLNLPVTETATNKENDLSNHVENKNMPSISNDTNRISIFKQWKVKVRIGKDGIPLSKESDIYIQLNEDGSYVSINILKDNTRIDSKGKFELINDNKLIIFYPDFENAKSTSAAIIKLTNKELVIKSENFETHHSVY